MTTFLRLSKIMPVVAPSASKFLVQDYSAPLEHVGFTKEDSAYAGYCCRLKRASDNAVLDIGWDADGKNWDQAAATTFQGASTCTVEIMYGQRGVSDLTPVTTAQLKYDTDGFPYVAGRMASTSTSFKTAKVHIFMVARRDYCKNSLSEHPIITYAMYGSAAFSTARWALGHSAGDGAWSIPKNGAFNQYEFQSGPGESRLGRWTVYDFNANTRTLKTSGDAMTPGETTADITYPTTTQLTVGGGGNTSNPLATGGWRSFTFYSAAQSTRDAITDHFITNCPNLGATYLPATVTDSDLPGFTFAPEYDFTWFDTRPADDFGITWVSQHGGYPWSCGVANNVNNGQPLVRFELREEDMEQHITGANRCERSATNRSFAPGQILWVKFNYFFPSSFPTQSLGGSDWYFPFQIHHNDDGTAQPFTPDAFCIDGKAGNFGFCTQRNGSTISHGSVTLTKGQWRSVVAKLTWANPRNAGNDKVECWEGAHGGTLTKVVDSALGDWFDSTASGAYLKEGAYRGQSPPFTSYSPATHFMASLDMSTSANAYVGIITTQDPIPTHA